MSFYKRRPDIVIKNGTIVDGYGTMPYKADIAIVGDTIDYIGNLQDVSAPCVIDATGKYITPGFIDSHTHSDFTIWSVPTCDSAVYQGVTTEIVGNCGFCQDHTLNGIPFDEAGDSVSCIYDMEKGSFRPGAIAAVLDKMEAMGASINTAWMCGHNGIREMAGLYTPEYTEEQFATMAAILREALEAGYIGFSTGLEFPPGVVSHPEEIERLVQIVAEYDGNYSSHMRDEGTYLFEAIEEFLNAVRKSGVRGTISHLNVKYDNGIPNEYLQKSMDMLKAARRDEHLDVMCDMLPTCFATGMTLAMLPSWVYADGWDEARRIMGTEEGRARIKADFNRYWRFLDAGEWDRLLYVQPKYWTEIGSKPFMELAKEWGKEPFDCFIDIVAAAPTLADAQTLEMQGIVFHEQTMVDSVVTAPIYMWMTDSRVTVEEGALASRTANVQNYMSMAYFFTRYVRELGAISIEKAVQKATSIPAKYYRLKKRGLLEEGYYADINVFDLDALKINAEFSNPCRFASGMDYVIVNGVPVIADGKHTGARSGKVLRHLPKK
ncbi:MAG: amidohydrolase family protein [Clostridia bacterium]|nr:amidohydrolase family protein [Clostridia bacterium]